MVHLYLRTKSLREVTEAELWNIYNTKVEIEEKLAELEPRVSQLTRSLEVEGRTYWLIDIEVLCPLEDILGCLTLARALLATTLDQV